MQDYELDSLKIIYSGTYTFEKLNNNVVLATNKNEQTKLLTNENYQNIDEVEYGYLHHITPDSIALYAVDNKELMSILSTSGTTTIYSLEDGSILAKIPKVLSKSYSLLYSESNLINPTEDNTLAIYNTRGKQLYKETCNELVLNYIDTSIKNKYLENSTIEVLDATKGKKWVDVFLCVTQVMIEENGSDLPENKYKIVAYNRRKDSIEIKEFESGVTLEYVGQGICEHIQNNFRKLIRII